MSYDLNIWSRQRVKTDQYEIKMGEYTINIEESVVVEEEDIPTEVLISYSDIKYLTSLYLQPYTNEKTIIEKAMRYAKKIAREFDGVVENPQLENSITLTNKRKTFALKEKTVETGFDMYY